MIVYPENKAFLHFVLPYLACSFFMIIISKCQMEILLFTCSGVCVAILFFILFGEINLFSFSFSFIFVLTQCDYRCKLHNDSMWKIGVLKYVSWRHHTRIKTAFHFILLFCWLVSWCRSQQKSHCEMVANFWHRQNFIAGCPRLQDCDIHPWSCLTVWHCTTILWPRSMIAPYFSHKGYLTSGRAKNCTICSRP